MTKLHQWPSEMPASVRALATNNPPTEAAVQVLAWLVRVVKVREVGVNAGTWVERFLGATGLSKGYAWCAALQTYVNQLVGLPTPPKGTAAVKTWHDWADATGRLIPVAKAQRGDILGMMHTATTGHMGRFVSRSGSTIKSFEGNTSPGVGGNQRVGDGAYERDRDGMWQWAIRMGA